MQTTLITSPTNERYKRWKKLADTPRTSKKLGVTLAEGIHLAQVIRDSEARVVSIVLRETGASAEAVQLAGELADVKDARVFTVSGALYDAICPVEHGVGLTLEFETIQTPRPHVPVRADVLYLDGVQDAGNMGTLIRTAVAAGVRYIAASSGSAGLWSPKVMRAGMGAHFGATLFENVTPRDLIDMFDARRLAADARGGSDLFRSTGWDEGPTVWMMGAEGPGLSDAALQVADARYLIPIEASCESLNVGAAAAVCLFEQRRRRLLRGE
jgi:TrmH family RNA methyltransferase